MKITDKTTEETDNRTFKQGDVVIASRIGDHDFYLMIIKVYYKLIPITLDGGNCWHHAQDGALYTFEKDQWTYRKVTAELVITD